MADTKTTAEAAATTLGGTELVRGVQSAANVKITIDQIKTWCSASPTLVTPALGVATATSLEIAAAGALSWTGRTQATSPADGVMLLSNAAANDFSQLKFGGSTSVFPSLRRNGAVLEVILADVSGYATFAAAAYRIDSTKVVGAQGAAVADSSGGAVVDAEARTALNALLARLRTHGLIAT